MIWNREEVRSVLDATITDEVSVSDGKPYFTIRFRDALLQYEMIIYEGEPWVCLSGDNSDQPTTALPIFETSINCTQIAPLPRGGMPTGIGFFLGGLKSEHIRFSITRREDGLLSLSGMWP